MKKLQLALIGLAGVVTLTVAGYSATRGGGGTSYELQNELFIPPLIDSRQQNGNIKITIKNTQHQFFKGVNSDTKSYSNANGVGQAYLGPTVRLYKGETTRITFDNQLSVPTTVHGHGLHIDGKVDGGPQNQLAAGETRVKALPIVQQAGLSWYHPHFMSKTAEQVHAGLAGLYIIEDANSLALPLPKNYGVDDIPLVVQDRTFVNKKMKPYAVTKEDIKRGLREDTLIVNGTIDPVKKVPAGWVRLRLLNGSNARFYRFYFANNVGFYKIATEGGFLNKPVAMKSLVMAPGERNEIMINTADLTQAKLMAEFLPADPGISSWLNGLFSSKKASQTALTLNVDKSLPALGKLPDTLNNIAFYTPAEKANAPERQFKLQMKPGMAKMKNIPNGQLMTNIFTINGQPMDMNVINAQVKKGQLELWTVRGQRMPHPFHVHGTSFQVISQNGKPVAEADRGWKDTVVVTGKPTQLLVRFNQTATKDYPYMYHCHILEHEDAGMMGQFTVE